MLCYCIDVYEVFIYISELIFVWLKKSLTFCDVCGEN